MTEQTIPPTFRGVNPDRALPQAEQPVEVRRYPRTPQIHHVFLAAMTAARPRQEEVKALPGAVPFLVVHYPCSRRRGRLLRVDPGAAVRFLDTLYARAGDLRPSDFYIAPYNDADANADPHPAPHTND